MGEKESRRADSNRLALLIRVSCFTAERGPRLSSTLSQDLSAGCHPRSAQRGTLARSVCSLGTLTMGIGPGFESRLLDFLPLFTRVRGRFLLRTSPLRSSEKFATRKQLQATAKIRCLGDVPDLTILVGCLPRAGGGPEEGSCP
jgi:hypothetical protein